jgi:hypothetical protein
VKILLAVPVLLLVAGCQTSAEYTASQQRPWINRSVREYAAANSLVPTRLDATTYVFGPPSGVSACRRTVVTDPDGQTIREITSNNC